MFSIYRNRFGDITRKIIILSDLMLLMGTSLPDVSYFVCCLLNFIEWISKPHWHVTPLGIDLMQCFEPLLDVATDYAVCNVRYSIQWAENMKQCKEVIICCDKQMWHNFTTTKIKAKNANLTGYVWIWLVSI